MANPSHDHIESRSCKVCLRPLTPEITTIIVANDDITELEVCLACGNGSLLSRWRCLSRGQRLFLALSGIVLIAVTAFLFYAFFSSRQARVGEFLASANSFSRQGKEREAMVAFTEALKLDPENVYANYSVGRIYLEDLGQATESIHWFEGALKRDPSFGPCHVGIARAAQQIGNNRLAHSHLDRLFSFGNLFMDGLFLKAQLLAKLGDTAGIEAIFRTMTLVSPSNPFGWSLLAEIRRLRGAADKEVEGLLNQAVLVGSTTPAVYLHRGNFFAERGRFSDAREDLFYASNLAPGNLTFIIPCSLLLEREGKPDEAIRFLQDQIKTTTGKDGDLLLLRILDICQNTGRMQEAQEALKTLKSHSPGNPGVLLIEGRGHFLKGEFARAKGILGEVLLSDRGDIAREARSMLLSIHVLEGNFASAASILEKENQVPPPDPIQRLNLALRFLQMGLSTETLQISSNLLPGQNPQELEDVLGYIREGAHGKGPLGIFSSSEGQAIFQRLSRAHWAKLRGDWPAALEEYDALASFAPQLPGFHFQRAMLLERMERWLEAVDAYGLVVRDTPGNLFARNNLAYLLAERDIDPKRALELVSLLPPEALSNPVMADTTAWVNIKNGRFQEALAILKPLAEQLPELAEVRFHHAHALLGMGKNLEAREELAQAFWRKPSLREHPSMAEVNRRLILKDLGQ